ncbi:hypothetical protein OH492_06620 [Vibrio chagasii]|nr:hypothetical protein [Vibrio chagasii]
MENDANVQFIERRFAAELDRDSKFVPSNVNFDLG